MADTLTYTDNPTRYATLQVDAGDGSRVPEYGRDLRNTPAISISSGTPNNQAGGGDTLLSAIYSIPASSNQDIDLQAFVDAAGRSGKSFARIKSVEIWLLATDDIATGLGSAASDITVTPGASNGQNLFLTGTAPGFNLKNGENLQWKTRSATGTTVDATHKVVNIANNDAGVAAKVFVQIVGGST